MITNKAEKTKVYIIEKTAESDKTAQMMITLFEGGIILAKSMNKPSYLLNALDKADEIINALKK